MKFIKNKTRLNCDQFEARRALTQKVKLEKWIAIDQGLITLNKDKYSFTGKVSEDPGLDDLISAVKWTGKMNCENQSYDVQMKFYQMKCGVKTEYCTEIQLLLEYEEEAEPLKAIYEQMALNVLDLLRRRFNQEWVILDTDLNASILRG